MAYKIPTTILRQYDIGAVRDMRLVTVGLIHQTFTLKTDRGQYIMQRLHPVLSSQKVADDFFAVTGHARTHGFPSPQCVLTKRGQILAKGGGHVWRLQTKLPGRTIETIKDVATAREAGRMYGQFHRAMDSIKYRFTSPLKLHETEKIFTKFKKIARAHTRDPLMEPVRWEVEFLLKMFPKFFLPKGLPRRVIHGDPKASNVLFTPPAKGGSGGVRASAIIDLDTCNRHTILVELGDAFRSWCGKREDDPKNSFSLPLFRAAWSGYQRGAGRFLTKREIALVPKAIGTITLELATRFLTDYFEDSYFGYDAARYPSRRAHNLARCRGQIAEFQDYDRKIHKRISRS